MNKSNIENNRLWSMAIEIAENAYDLLNDFPEEEKWGMQSKLRARAFDASNDIAEALGSIDPRDIKWHLGLARRSLFGQKNIIILAAKVGYIDTNAALLRQIDTLADLVDIEIDQATKTIPLWFKEMNDKSEVNK